MTSTKPFLLPLALTALILAGCATTPKKEKEPDKTFQLPESVQVDLSGAKQGESSQPAKPEQRPAEGQAAPEKAATQTGTPSATGTTPPTGQPKSGVTDQDSAAVLQRMKAAKQQPETPVVTHSPQQVKQAEEAGPEFNRALIEMKKGNLDSALARFQKLAQQYPLLGGPIVNEAIILRKKGQLEQANKLLQDNLLAHTQNPYLLDELGITSRELGQFKKARASYESAIRVDPNYARAHYNLAVLADLYLHDPELALKEFKIYQSLLPTPDKQVAGWLLEIERRIARKKK